MSIASNKALINRLFSDVLNRKNPSAIHEIIAEDYFEQDLLEGQSQGVKGVEERLQILLNAFPDAKYELLDIVADENKVAARWKMIGTHKGEYLNIQPTNRAVVLKGIDIYEIDKGLIISHWNEVNMLGLINQIRGE